MARINVTKTYLPNQATYLNYIQQIWDSVYLTNNGPFLQQLEKDICKFLPTKNLLVCSNGTIVLQMALKAFNITGEVITTPFSYVATLNAIVWENCKPVFADIDPETLCISPESIESVITPQTQAIIATHVYGYPCDVERINAIAAKHNLKVIYDAAHAFGSVLNGQSLLNYGDISTCSFHATKIFHTVEGGSIIAKDDTVFDTLFKLRQFGHIYDDYYLPGINAKNSEVHAAMGLSVLPDVPRIIQERKQVSELYDTLLPDVSRPSFPKENFSYNYGYYPIILESEAQTMEIKNKLEAEDIFPRRYFYPSLNMLPYVKEFAGKCPVSEDISRRVLCLPLYAGLAKEDVHRIAHIVQQKTTPALS
ncbi:MAG TPA: DegT/DnrJ/EryC1/StrS family aminotransferase [Ferruginibacter sp.]|nr:DegT/DnrJ/EryC1/StrS family aminotransferase [Ferruginibacter sp.]HRO16757.1 DegT/DnrJ/EryC1/StrS family aminotransferase [Ferruginibacter sp.]HRQ19803.1 DegT/DnrJ/EryC1/StrS family aminotransferase [Ferruginibacter sp.]